MKKIINLILFVLKFLLFLGAFASSVYIVISMYRRLNKNVTESIDVFMPYFILLILFFINIIFRQKTVNQNIFYNLSCCLVFLTTILVGIRAIYDTNMILNKIMGYNINFIYFEEYIVFMKLLMYGLSFGNILFMFSFNEKIKENTIEKKFDTEVL